MLPAREILFFPASPPKRPAVTVLCSTVTTAVTPTPAAPAAPTEAAMARIWESSKAEMSSLLAEMDTFFWAWARVTWSEMMISTVPVTEAVPLPLPPAASELMYSMESAASFTSPPAWMIAPSPNSATVLPLNQVTTATGLTATVPLPAKAAATLNRSVLLFAVTSTLPPAVTLPPRLASRSFSKASALVLTLTDAVPLPAKLRASRYSLSEDSAAALILPLARMLPPTPTLASMFLS